MNELTSNGVDYSKFDLEWASRGGVLICDEAEALFKLITFSCGEGCANDSCNHWVVVASITSAYNESKYKLYNRRLWGMRMATPAECADAGVEYIEPPMMWRDMDSYEPPVRTPILLLSRTIDGDLVVHGSYRDSEWLDAYGNIVRNPTHWMPLPNLPKENNNVITTERNPNG